MADSFRIGIFADDQTRKGLSSAEKGLKGFGEVGSRAIGLATKAVAAGTAAVAGLAAGVALLTKNQAALVKEIKLVSDTTGVAVKQVSAWTEEFRRFGLETEDVRDILNELNIKQGDALAGTESIIEAYAVFGLSLQDIADLNAHEQLLAIADGFAEVENHAMAAWAADAIFGGDMAQRTIPILLQGSDALQAHAAEYENLGLVIDERAVAASERYNKAQTELNQTVRGFGSAIANAAMPHVTNLINALNAILRLGKGFLPVLDGMLKGTISFSQGFDQAFAALPPAMQTYIATLGLNFTAGLNSMLESVWDFGFQVSAGFAQAINNVLSSIESAIGQPGAFGRAEVRGEFTGAAPKITAPQALTDFAQTWQREPLTVTLPGAGAQTYTAVAGDTPSGIAALTGLTLAQVRAQNPGTDRTLPIGTEFSYGALGGGRTLTGERIYRDAGVRAAYDAYQQSLVGRDRSTPEAEAAAARSFQEGVEDWLNDIRLNPGRAALVGLGGTLGIGAGLRFADWATLGIPRRLLQTGARGARTAISGMFRAGQRTPGIYNNRLTQGLVNRAVSGVGNVDAFGRPTGRTFGATGVGLVDDLGRPIGRTFGASGVGYVDDLGRPLSRTFMPSGVGFVDDLGRPAGRTFSVVDDILRARGISNLNFRGLARPGTAATSQADPRIGGVLGPDQLLARQATRRLRLSSLGPVRLDPINLGDEFGEVLGYQLDSEQAARMLEQIGITPRQPGTLSRFLQSPAVRFGARWIGRLAPLADLLALGGSQPGEGRGNVNFSQGSGARSNIPYFDVRRFLQARSQFLPPGGTGGTFQPVGAVAPGPGFNPVLNQLGQVPGFTPWQADPWFSATGGTWTSNPLGYRGTPVIINIQVDDQREFVEKLTDALESGDVPASFQEAYDLERRGGE